MPAKLEITLFGPLNLRLDGEPVDLASRQLQKLLAYLLLNAGQTTPRPTLAGALWPDSPEPTARKNLRQYLWRLRRAIGDEYLKTTRDTAAFNAEADYWLDVKALEQAPADDTTDSLIEAVSVYQGELLPGFYADWLLLERERLQAVFERRMQALLGRLAAEVRWSDLIAWAEHWITQAYAPEPAYRALMTAAAGLGDLSGVAKHYQRCQKALQEELGVEPSAETQALFERLTRGEQQPIIETPTDPVHALPKSNQLYQALPEGTVTFLFTDIQGSTDLLQALGDQYITLLADHHRILREVFDRWKGQEVSTEGDSFFVSFARATDAVAAAVETQRALVAHNWPGGVQVRVRMGLHTGEPWHVEESYAGMDVHRAARIANAGQGGQVLLSETTAALARGALPEGVQLLDLGRHQLKDLPQPEQIQQLVIEGLPADFPPLKSLAMIQAAGTVASTLARLPAFLAEGQPEPELPVFVGRQRELARLAGYLETALEGNGQVAFLAGDAGSGKSSLLSAFTIRAGEREPDLLVGWGICNAFSGRGDPYLPFRKVLSTLTGDLEAEWAAGTITGEQARTMWVAMPAAIEALLDHGPDLLGTILPAGPLLSRLQSAYPDGHPLIERLKAGSADGPAAAPTERAQLFEQVTATLRRLTQERPLVLVLDDLQWADRGSLDLLFHLTRGLAGARILLLIAYRPDEVAAGEDHPLRPLLDEFRRGHGDVWLDLNRAPGRAFVDELIDSEVNRLDDSFREMITKRTSGHPLFTVELMRDMQERGDLVKDRSGNWTLGPTLNWDTLPARVEGAIAARIGRLDERLRDILSVAAVEGEVFTAQVVARVQKIQERQLLRTLSGELSKRHRLVQEDQTERYGQQLISLYRFTHHLFQRYLYNDLSDTERRLLHGEVGRVLETLYEDKTDEVVVQLARHFDEAGESEKAASFLLVAGDRARLLYANDEAIGHYQRALEHLQIIGDNERLARAWMRLGLTHHNAFDYRRSRQAYDQGFAVWREAGRTAEPQSAGSTLRVWYVSPNSLDPPHVIGENSAVWVRQLFSKLVELDDEGIVVPDIARRWQIRDGGQTYVFHLREDARWSDGHPVTAGDFVLACQRALDPRTQHVLAEQLDDISGARGYHLGQLSKDQLGLQAKDDHTLIVELAQPASYFLHLLAEIICPVPQHKIAEFGDSWAEPARIVTNGPYMISNWSPGRAASLVRNPYYHGAYGGNVDRVEVLVTDSEYGWEEAMARYARGDMDIVEASVFPGRAFSVAKAQFGENSITVPSLGTFSISFNPYVPPLDNADLRRALAMVIDRDYLARSLSAEQAAPAHGGWIPHGMAGHSPDIGLPFDPTTARRLLADAGYPGGKGLPLLEVIWADTPANRDQGNYLAKQWQDWLGITSEPVYLPAYEWVQSLHPDLPPMIHFRSWGADFPDPEDFLRRGVGTALRQNEKLEAITETAARTTDQQKRLALYRQADKMLIDEALIIPLTYGLHHYFTSPRIRNFPATSRLTLRWRDIVVDPD